MTIGIDTPAQSGDLEHFGEFLRKYRASPEMRARAETEPRAVLSENGVSLPAGHDVRIVENTAEVRHFVLPPDPNADLADEDLAAVAGGTSDGKTAFCLISCISTFSG